MPYESKGILIKTVSKKLGRKQILQHVHLEVQPGETVGITGENGSGKTTLLRIIAGIIYADQGEVYVNRKKIQPGFVGNIPTSIGILIEHPAFLPQFTGFENLYMLAGIRNKISKQTITDCMQQVGLDPNNRKLVKSYSVGMRQRLGIAQAIMEQPQVLLLDEPTNGLDEAGLTMFYELWSEQVQRKTAIILVSHQKSEIQQYCDKVYLIEHGHLSLSQEHRTSSWTIVLKSMEELERMYQVTPTLQLTDRVHGNPACIISGTWENRAQVDHYLKQNNIVAVEVNIRT
ncbi:ABC transporter ATP-binding protein [Paenibacillus popilliae]|uniref:ATPase component n=1 Tax=Paenibacillus popilliae ATCC 14706 TaxID=1212764 RepID=M9LPX4_PAEPP|nr:ABC transporter ATP-binding protein [Paenibacillus popilliae]GAC42651.1 ATPase component [Paenibacillus popilliae ATCC 14706]